MNRLLVLMLAIWCYWSHQNRCRVPAGWYINGAQPSGSYELRPVLGNKQDDLVDAWLRRELEGPAPVRGWLYCTNGMTLRQDGQSVWCSR